MEFQQNLSLQHRQILSAQQLQSLALLAAPAQMLDEYLNEQFLENPVLELADQPDSRFVRISIDQDDWPAHARRTKSSAAHEQARSLEDYSRFFSVSDRSLRETLLLQVSMETDDAELECAAKVIIESLDGNGYLRTPLDELAVLLGCTLEQMHAALALVQKLEPPGLGARTMQECLQLQVSPDAPNAQCILRILAEHLENVSAGRYRQISQDLGISQSQVNEAVAYIRSLSPYPAPSLDREQAAHYIIPDVLITADNGELDIAVCGNRTCLQLNDAYVSLYRSCRSSEVGAYLQNKISNAKQLLRNLDQRQQTISKIASIVFRRQCGFFHCGVAGLQPLTLHDVALEADLHESTVSRAVSDKYVQTPCGVFPWKFFFPREVKTLDGRIVTNTYVKALIAKCILQEDPLSPLHDSDIETYLSENQICIARRTIAKYRQEAGFLSRSQRKRTG